MKLSQNDESEKRQKENTAGGSLEVWKVEEVGAKESKTVGGLLQVVYC